MIDLIIPTYKNKEGLRRTLASITPCPEITVTVIDDCSGIYYNDILEEFPFFNIYYNKKNIGPGLTRQTGIDLTNNPYVMFLDTGDYYLNDKVLPIMIATIQEHPDTVIFSWQYELHGKVSADTNNRMHGRVYKREFLNTYNIRFCPESSYINEDIGFNRLCRIIVQDKKLEVLVFARPVIFYDQDDNSITHRNNGEFFYNQQNEGLALNTIHTLQVAEKNGLSQEVILQELNGVMAGLYYCFIRTQYERPEFIQNAWNGAKLFYDKCFVNYTNNSNNLLVIAFSPYIKKIYSLVPHWKNFKPINILRFIKDIKLYKRVPKEYLN